MRNIRKQKETENHYKMNLNSGRNLLISGNESFDFLGNMIFRKAEV